MSTIDPVQPFVLGRNSLPEQDGVATPVTDDAFSMIGDDPTSHIGERGRYIKDLFEGEPTCQCCVQWIDELPEDLALDDQESEDEDVKENENVNKDENIPLLIRRRRTHGGSKTWEVHCIEIQNAALRAVLLRIFDNYEFLRPTLKYLTLFAPFHPFHHAWDKFEAAIKEEKDETVLNSLRILKRLVRLSLGSDPSVSKELIASGVISYSCLWTLFKPGDLLYSAIGGGDAFVRLQSISRDMRLVTSYIDWDGNRFGWVNRYITLQFFEGTKEITKLEAYPAHLHPNYEQLKKLLILRGKKFSDLAGIHTKTYLDITREELANPDSNQTKIGRRIIVDAKSNPNPNLQIMFNLWSNIPQHTYMIEQQPFKSSGSGQGAQHVPLDPNNKWKNQSFQHRIMMMGIPPPPPGNTFPPPRCGAGRMKGRKKGRKAPLQLLSQLHPKSDGKDAELTPNELMLCNFKVMGFCLRDRRWRVFEVDRIRDVEWNEEPFDNLVLPEGYKDLILAFVDSQLTQNEHFEDVINGKGGGLVILLCGAPGVGKTLTAESVAEKIKVPLFKMEFNEDVEEVTDISSSSDEGQVRPNRYKKPSKLTIEGQFEYATNWNAVLLFDECDAHLGKRSDGDSEQRLVLNKFLQKLEYFPSLLFLTTNHADSLDPAIASRVHLTINYPTLNAESRLTIWRNFLDRANPPAVLSWKEIELLSGIELNGRRIRNVVKTAQIMAKRDRRAVRLDDIKKVMKITEGVCVE